MFWNVAILQRQCIGLVLYSFSHFCYVYSLLLFLEQLIGPCELDDCKFQFKIASFVSSFTCFIPCDARMHFYPQRLIDHPFSLVSSLIFFLFLILTYCGYYGSNFAFSPYYNRFTFFLQTETAILPDYQNTSLPSTYIL